MIWIALIISIVLLVLKVAAIGAFATISWWLVAAPVLLAVAWVLFWVLVLTISAVAVGVLSGK